MLSTFCEELRVALPKVTGPEATPILKIPPVLGFTAAGVVAAGADVVVAGFVVVAAAVVAAGAEVVVAGLVVVAGAVVVA